MYYELCMTRYRRIHETTVRRVRDLPLFEYRVVLHVPAAGSGASAVAARDWRSWRGWAAISE
ncbi:hypothetical protein [Burkholderia ubonensis]|uniref:hypothetical protein n=1 Tax=Burkholderia ubonensis TaxID=101571 RepID=UPI0039F4E005